MENVSKSRKLVIHLLLLCGAILMIGPFLWMILTSLKTVGEAAQIPPKIFPEVFQWSNYKEIFDSFPFAGFYWNTFITTIIKTIGQLFLCSLAAYAFARIKFPGRNFFFILYLSVLRIPPQAFLIPQYQIIANLDLLNTLTALVLPGLFSAFGTFLLRQFFMTMPDELEEAAKIDGCNHFQIYWRIMLPLAKPGLIALAIFTILWSWNDFLWPLIVNSSPDKMPLSAGLASLQGQYSTNYPVLMAGTFLASWPLIIIFMLFQKAFVEGIALSGRKG
ncbi:ABC transporter permease subunit [Agaribacter marinus]|uniref:Carbohydrate ABC transporter permease n=1 Tax=Virgibacillus salarius TaxID=447199 RepID=A0A941I9N6_9BACI|nr:carbohydrate ABC transporter permease [Virgibacillus salarius]MBR7795738.1 carbohydrate ABC transporter permease [Virgibacillus salarius]NAZ08451.1 ABC transporter permease subunit [Agaribacter marinus]